MADPKTVPAAKHQTLDPDAQTAALPAVRARAGRAFAAVKRVLPGARKPADRPGGALAPGNGALVGTAQFIPRSTFYAFRQRELLEARRTALGVQRLRGRIDHVANRIDAIKIPTQVGVTTQMSVADAQRINDLKQAIADVGAEIARLRPAGGTTGAPPGTALSAAAFGLIAAVNVLTTQLLDRKNVDASSVLQKLKRLAAHCKRIEAGLAPYPAALAPFQAATDPAYFEAALQTDTGGASPEVAVEVVRRVGLLIDTTNVIAREASGPPQFAGTARARRPKAAPRRGRAAAKGARGRRARKR